jgi:hypothetical protein
MALNSVELVQLAALQLELERLEYIVCDRSDIEYSMVQRWLKNRIRELKNDQ